MSIGQTKGGKSPKGFPVLKSCQDIGKKRSNAERSSRGMKKKFKSLSTLSEKNPHWGEGFPVGEIRTQKARLKGK